MLLGIATSMAENIGDLGLFVRKVVCVYRQFAYNLDLLAVEGWVLSVRKDRWV